MSDYITPVMYIDRDGNSPTWWNPFSWSNETKIIVGVVFIVAGLIATVATGGAFLPALLATAKAVGISMGVSATIGGSVGGLVSLANDGDFWSGAIDGFIDGAVDGFMWGGIFSGTSQMLGSASKILAGRQVDFSKNVNLLYGNQNSQSTTLLRINKAGKQLFRFDVDPTHLLHIHYGVGKTMRIHRMLAPLLGYNALVNGTKGILDGF